jgi:hypothetical protein
MGAVLAAACVDAFGSPTGRCTESGRGVGCASALRSACACGSGRHGGQNSI